MKRVKDTDALCPFTGELCKKGSCIAYIDADADNPYCLFVKR